MKNARILLGSAAFALAAGISFISVSTEAGLQSGNRVRVRNVQGGAITCIPTSKSCDNIQGSVCKIQVQTQNGVVAVNAHPDASCTTTLLNSTGTISGVYTPPTIPFEALD